CMHALQTPYNF
nr:immunoglobulin light chain junction region [Macaca mulatta]